MAATITSRDELLAMLADLDARETVESAATGPAERAAATPLRRLQAEAPALPPLKLPKLNVKNLNSATITTLVDAGRDAAIVLTARGVRVVESIEALDLDDPTVVVLAQHDEVDAALAVEGATKLTVARELLDRELDAAEASRGVLIRRAA